MRKTLTIIGVILTICLIVSPDVPSQQSNGGKFIRRWVACGPFITGKPADEAIETDHVGEAARVKGTHEGPPYPGMAITLEGYPTQVREWTILRLPEDGDINRMLLGEGEVDYAVAYLMTYVESQEEMEKELLIRFDDVVRVWFNYGVVYTSKAKPPLTADEDRFVVKLKKGINMLSLKIADTVGDWTLSLRFANDDGLKFCDDHTGRLLPVGKRLPRLPEPQEPKWLTTEAGLRMDYHCADELVSIDVNTIHQDTEGVMWFGTYNGAHRFDGKEWITYTTEDGLAHNHVWDIHQDRQGNMWFGTRAGVSCFDEKKQIWVTYTETAGLAENHIKAIYQDIQGNMWFGTYGGGLSRFDGKQWTTYSGEDGLANNYVYTIRQDREGNVWFGTLGGASCFDGREWTTYGWDKLWRAEVLAIHQDSEGRIWIGGLGSLACLESKDRAISKHGEAIGQPVVGAIHQDASENIWVGTNGAGLWSFDGKEWMSHGVFDYVDHTPYAYNYVRDICRDREGNIWFATAGGVSHFDVREWAIYRRWHGLAHEYVRAIHQDREAKVWFGTGGGVSCFDGKQWTSYTTENGLVHDRIYDIHQDNEGNMWFGTYGGASRFDGEEWISYTQEDGLAYDCVYAIGQDSEGNIWLGMSGGGISCFNGEGWVTHTIKEATPRNHVYSICQDNRGNMWFSVYGTGVSCFDGKEWITYTQKDGLADDYIHSICQDNEGRIWFGSNGDGISCFDGEIWVNYTRKAGLADDYIYVVQRDREGNMWFGTHNGVSRFDGRCFQSVNSKDGLVTDNVQSIYADKDGNIWIGTDKGVARFTPGKVAPLVHINQVIADKPYDKPKDAVRLPSNVQRISFAFRGISFKTRPEEMKYFYQLVGRDADWLGPTHEETIDYLDLEPGRYTFQVQAVDRDLNYSDPPASLGIAISSPPFYKSGLFIIFAVAATLCIPFIVYSRQKRKSTAGFEPIPNPYMAGGPVRSEEMFFGREEDFRFVRNKLETEKEGIVIVFCGQRRSGKTSLLHQIRNGRLGEGFMPVLIDMQEMAVNSDGEFYERIAEEVSSDLSGLVDVNLAKYNFHTGDTSPALVFEEFMDDVMERADDRTLLLMFDEYELLEEKMNEGTISSDTPTFFAGTLERHPRISFIFTGSRHLEARNPRYWRILFGKSTARRISLLGERDTLRLVKEPVADTVRYQRGVPERIYRLTGGQPFYTQHICQLLIDRLNQLERHKVHADDVEKIALELADNSPPQMSYFWNEELGRKERLVLVLLGRMLDSPDSYVSASMVAEYAASKEEDVGLEMLQIARILDGLCEYELLERERVSEETHEYRYKIDIFRYWVQRHQSIGQAMDEVDGESADG